MPYSPCISLFFEAHLSRAKCQISWHMISSEFHQNHDVIWRYTVLNQWIQSKSGLETEWRSSRCLLPPTSSPSSLFHMTERRGWSNKRPCKLNLGCASGFNLKTSPLIGYRRLSWYNGHIEKFYRDMNSKWTAWWLMMNIKVNSMMNGTMIQWGYHMFCWTGIMLCWWYHHEYERIM